MVTRFHNLGNRGLERWTLATLSGLLNGAAFIDLGILSLIANVPLLLALRQSSSATESALLGGLVGLLAGTHIYGIVNYGWFLLIGFGFYTASQMVIYGLLFRALWNRGNALLDVLLPAFIWALTEWIRTIGPLCMPASYVGNIADVAALKPWLWLAPITGGLGVSTAVALVGSLVFHIIIGKKHHLKWIVALGLTWCGLGVIGATSVDQSDGRPIKIAAIQGGLANSHYDAALVDHAAMANVVRTYEHLNSKAYRDEPDLVLWPETAIRAPVLSTGSLRERLAPPAGSKTHLLAGVVETDRMGRRYNTVAVIKANGQIGDVYRKIRLVPGVEGHFRPGDRPQSLSAGSTQVGVLICLESVYPDAGLERTRQGAEILVVASNDAGFGWSPITHHMLNRAIVRAVETGRWLVRIGQAGVTRVIDPRGSVVGNIDLFKPAVLRQTVQALTRKTLFVRWGNWWIWVVIFILFWALVNTLGARRESANQKRV